MAEFQGSIANLRERANRCRRLVTLCMSVLILIVTLSFMFVVYRYSATELKSASIFPSSWIDRDHLSADSLFLPRIEQILKDAYGQSTEKVIDERTKGTKTTILSPAEIATKEVLERDRAQMDQLIAYYERVQKAAADGKSITGNAPGSSIAPIVSTLAISVGAVALMIFVIQIMVTFMRYYARLGELYDAQAEALQVSDNNAETAYKFIEKFSPLAVDFGAIPTSLQEKAVSAVIDVAKSKAKKGAV